MAGGQQDTGYSDLTPTQADCNGDQCVLLAWKRPLISEHQSSFLTYVPAALGA